MTKTWIFFICIGLSFAQTFFKPVFAQKHFFKNFSLEEGLPQSEVWDILEDKRGNLWVGTNGGGVCRFNGFHFEVFNTKNGLPDNQVKHLFQDSKGNIWFFTFNGIAIYDGYKIRVLKDDHLIKNNFARIYEKDGKIWLYLFQSQNDYKLVIIDNEKITNVKSLPEFDALFKENDVFAMFKDKNDQFYFDTRNGLYEYDGKKLFKSSLYQLPEFQKDGINRIIPVLEEKNGTLWVIAPIGNNANLYKGDRNGMQLITTPFNVGNVNLGYQDSQGRVWFIEREGLVKYENGMFKRFNQYNGLTSNVLNCITEDHEGNIWLGSPGSGMFRYNGDRFLTFDMNSGLKVNIVRSIIQDKNDNLWFGMVGGLHKYDGEKIKDYLFNGKPDIGRIKQMYVEENGSLLLSTDIGLLRFKDGQARNVDNEFQIPANTAVSYFLKDEDAYWIGLWGGGVIRYESKDKVQVWNTANGALRNNIVHSLFKDSKGKIWICTNLGLYTYDGANFTGMTNENGLTKDLIMQVTEDKKGRIWIATYGGGINIYDGKKITVVNQDNSNLASNTIYSIISDDEQNIWVGTQYGVDKIVLNEQSEIVQIRNFNKSDGFLGVETNGASNYKDHLGNLWFGTISGAMKYSPKDDKVYNKAPIVHITNVRLFFKKVDWSDKSYASYYSKVNSWFNLPEELVLPYDSNHVSFDFEAIYYSNPNGVRYQWKMEGVDKDWSPVTNKTEVSYPNLMPGRYTFLVRACNKDGIWTEKPVSFIFRIRPPWWQLAWVQLLFLSLVVGSVFAGVRIRILSIKARQKELERLVDQKTIEVRQQNAEILAKNAELEQQKEEIIVQSENLKEANKEITEQKEIIQRKNEDISSSIEYAKHIQDAMLPSLDRIKAAIPEFFIFFKPRDVVSGDFYWFAEKPYPNSRKIIFACVDCTGHGVPGAFMSMIGDSVLDHIVHDKEIHEGDKILNEMHKAIHQTLNQEETYNRDGMDISIIVIDMPNDSKHEITLEFAGAKTVMLYSFKDDNGIIKGDNFPVGGEQLEQERIFNKKVLKFKKESAEDKLTIYVSSDGYQDQFGGPNSKKFMTFRFRELLFSMKDMSMEEQKKKLDHTLSDWMQGHDQIDDILVTGIRI